jgi:hypothetical protein
MEESLSPLARWESFYVIVGSSAAVLTGLQFVVIGLVTEVRKRATSGQLDAFATPTIIHFCAALLVSAALSAPWPALSGAALFLGASGVLGVGYIFLVTRRAVRQTGYRPVLEDWIWHVVLPLVAYGSLLAAAVALDRHSTTALFMVGASALLLLFVGIHNAWDTVTFIALERIGAGDEQDDGNDASGTPPR